MKIMFNIQIIEHYNCWGNNLIVMSYIWMIQAMSSFVAILILDNVVVSIMLKEKEKNMHNW